MPPEKHPSGSPEDWLRYAHSDLELARVPPPPKVLFEGLCFHAQQAAEKSLKAVWFLTQYLFQKPIALECWLISCPES